jgi:hypothetical protein
MVKTNLLPPSSRHKDGQSLRFFETLLFIIDTTRRQMPQNCPFIIHSHHDLKYHA